MKYEILHLIENYQKGSNDALVILLSRYKPLLKKYSRIINIEDAYEELQLNFIESLQKINTAKILIKENGAMVNYIKAIIKNSAIKINKASKIKKANCFTFDFTNDKFCDVKSICFIDHNEQLLFNDLEKILTQKEYKIIKLHYRYGFSICEISKINKTSRQTTNSTKISALNKLKRYFDDSL